MNFRIRLLGFPKIPVEVLIGSIVWIYWNHILIWRELASCDTYFSHHFPSVCLSIKKNALKEVHVEHTWVCSSVSFPGFPAGASGKEPACQCRRLKRHGFNPCVGKIPWRRKCQPTPVVFPGESHGQRSLVGCSPWRVGKSQTRLSTRTHARACARTHTYLFLVVVTVKVLVARKAFSFCCCTDRSFFSPLFCNLSGYY